MNFKELTKQISSSALKGFFHLLLLSLIIISGFSYYQKIHLYLLSSEQGDFACFFNAALMLREGLNPYDFELARAHYDTLGLRFRFAPYLFLPLYAYLIQPLTYLSYTQAKLIWLIINHVLLFSSIWLMFILVRKRNFLDIFNFSLLFSLTLFFKPILTGLIEGQIHLLILFLLLASLISLRYRYCILSGLFLALGIHFKLFPAILLIFFLLKKDYKSAFWTIFFFLIFISVDVLIMKRAYLYISYLKNVLPELWKVKVITISQSLPSFLMRIFTCNFYGCLIDFNSLVVSWLGRILSFILLLISLYSLGSLKKKRESFLIYSLQYFFLILVEILIAPRGWNHYFVWFLPLFFILFNLYLEEKLPLRYFYTGAVCYFFLAIDLGEEILEIIKLIIPQASEGFIFFFFSSFEFYILLLLWISLLFLFQNLKRT